MKIILTILGFCLLGFTGMAKSTLLRGGYLDLEGTRVEGFIHYAESRHTPGRFYFSLDSNLQGKTQITTSNALEVFINGKGVFTVKEASIITSNNTDTPEPHFETQKVFVEKLIQGALEVFKYTGNNGTQFFYQKPNESLTVLVYHRYRNASGDFKENAYFKTQLWRNFQCGDFQVTDLNQVVYTQQSLLKFFSAYLKCSETSFTILEAKRPKGNLDLLLGCGISSVSTTVISANHPIAYNVNFGANFLVRPALQLNYTFPYWHRHWLLLSELAWFDYTRSAEKTAPLQDPQTVTIRGQAVELLLGMGYLIEFNSANQLLFGCRAVTPIRLGGTVSYEYGARVFDFQRTISLNFNVRYTLHKRFHLELSHTLPHQFSRFTNTKTPLNISSLSLYYTLL